MSQETTGLKAEKNIIEKADKKSAEALANAERDLAELQKQIAEKKELYKKEHGEISKAEILKFEEKQEISHYRLVQIAEKIRTQGEEKLDPMEKAFYEAKPEEVNAIIAEKEPTLSKEDTKELKKKSREATKKLLADEKKKEEEEAEAEKVRNKNQSGATDKERTEIASDFKSDYGIDPFAQIPGFADMTPGQWKLIYQNLAQIKLDYVETESQHAFAKRVQDAGTNSGSMLGKISGYAKIAGLNLNKGYILNEERKKAKANLDSGGMQVYGKSLNALVDSIKKTGLGVSLDASMDQEYRIEYASGLENLTKEEKEIIEEFNRAATEFGQIPKEWSFERGEIQKTLTGDWSTRKNKENFETFKARYEEEKKNLVEILRNKFGNDENKVFQYLGQIDNNVLFNQMINTDPKAIKALEDIENSKSWMKGIKKDRLVATGIYGITGAISRGAATMAAGASTAVVPVALAFGAIRGVFNASKNIAEKERLARKGVRTTDEVTKNLLAKFKNIETKNLRERKGDKGEIIASREMNTITERLEKLTGHVQGLTQELANAQTPEEKEKIEKSLDTAMMTLQNRLAYIQQKVDAGEINYGDSEVRIINQHNLTTALNNAYGVAFVNKAMQDKKVRKDIEDRIESLYKGADKKSWAKTELYTGSIVKGMIYGSIVGKLGYEFRDWLHGDAVPEQGGAVIGGENYGDSSAVAESSGIKPVNTGVETYLNHGDISEGVKKGFGTLENLGAGHEITQPFSLELGKNGVPAQLERVFHAISLDHMNIPSGTVDEEIGAKSLNMAANLVRLSEGHNVGGITADAYEKVFDFKDGVLKVNDVEKFNNLMDVLEKRADTSWDAGKLGGALGETSNIKNETWLKITRADGLEKVNIEGHDEITQDKITDFSKSEDVLKARAIHHQALPNPDDASGADKYKLDNSKIDLADYGSGAQGANKYDLANYNDGANAQGADRYDFADYGQTNENAIPKQNAEEFLRGEKIKEVISKPAGELTPTPPKPEDVYSTPEEPNNIEDTAPTEEIKEVVATPEAQTNDILEKIFGIDDISKSQDWAEASKKPAQGMLDIRSSMIKSGEVSNPVIQKIWAYTNYMQSRLKIEPLAGEKLGDFLDRAAKVFLDRYPKNTLNEALESSKLFLKEAQGK